MVHVLTTGTDRDTEEGPPPIFFSLRALALHPPVQKRTCIRDKHRDSYAKNFEK